MGINLICCWPGLSALWYRGHARGVLLAVLFCWVMCLLMLATFFWPEWVGVWLIRLTWAMAGLTWITSSVRSHWTLGRLLGTPDRQAQAVLMQAQEEYLRGNWFEAEAVLMDLLQQFPRDAEALLLLVGVLRHTKRWKPALRRLDQLDSLDTSAPWKFEILRERRLIASKFTEASADDVPRDLNAES